MKRKVLISVLAIALVLTLCIGMFVACDPKDSTKSTKYTVTYSLGDYQGTGTAPAAQEVEAGSKTKLPEVGATWTGHKFTGWKAGEGELLAAGTEVEVTADATYIAQWEEKAAPKVTLYYTLGTELKSLALAAESIMDSEEGTYMLVQEPELFVPDEEYDQYVAQCGMAQVFAYYYYDAAEADHKGAAFDYTSFDNDDDFGIIIFIESIGTPATAEDMAAFVGDYKAEGPRGMVFTLSIPQGGMATLTLNAESPINVSTFDNTIYKTSDGKLVFIEKNEYDWDEDGTVDSTFYNYYYFAKNDDGSLTMTSDVIGAEFKKIELPTIKVYYPIDANGTLHSYDATSMLAEDGTFYMLDEPYFGVPEDNGDWEKLEALKAKEKVFGYYYYDDSKTDKKGDKFDWHSFEAEGNFSILIAIDSIGTEAYFINSEWYGYYTAPSRFGGEDFTLELNDEDGGTIILDVTGGFGEPITQSINAGMMAKNPMIYTSTDGKTLILLELSYDGSSYNYYYITKNEDGTISVSSESISLTFTKATKPAPAVTATIYYTMGEELKSTTAEATPAGGDQYELFEMPEWYIDEADYDAFMEGLKYGTELKYYYYDEDAEDHKGEEFDAYGTFSQSISILVTFETFATPAFYIDEKYVGLYTGTCRLGDFTLLVLAEDGMIKLDYGDDEDAPFPVEASIQDGTILTTKEGKLVFAEGFGQYTHYYYLTENSGAMTLDSEYYTASLMKKRYTVDIYYMMGDEMKSTVAEAIPEIGGRFTLAENPEWYIDEADYDDYMADFVYGTSLKYYFFSSKSDDNKGSEFDIEGTFMGNIAIILDIEKFADPAESIDKKFTGPCGTFFGTCERWGNFTLTIDAEEGTIKLDYGDDEEDPNPVESSIEGGTILLTTEDGKLVFVEEAWNQSVADAHYYFLTANEDGTFTLDSEYYEDITLTPGYIVTLNGADDYTKEVLVKEGEFLTIPEDFPMTEKYSDGTHTLSFLYFTGKVSGYREFDYETIPITENMTLTAQYAAKITYDLNGATQSEEAPLFDWTESGYYYGYNESLSGLPTLEDLNASYEGFRFVGWKRSDTEEIKDAGSYKNGYTYFRYDTTFTAQWKEIKESYTITYKADGNDSFATQTVNHGATTTALTPAPTYNQDQSLYFAFWAIEGTEDEFSFSTEIMEDYTLVAIYRHFFSFDIGDGAQGTAPAPQVMGKSTGNYTMPDSTGFSKQGQKLVGWTLKDDKSGKVYRIGEEGSYGNGAKNETFVAKWMDATKKVTLKFVPNEGATGTMQDVECAPYSEYTLPEPTFQMKEGYISFEHWEYNDAAGEKKTIKANESIKLNEETEITFTAVYSDLITGSATEGKLLHLHLATKKGDFNGFELSFTLEENNISLTITFTPSDDKPVNQSVATAKGTIDIENEKVNIVIYYNYVAYEYGNAKAVNEITKPLSGYYTSSDADTKFGFTTDGKLFAFDGEKTTQTTYYQVGDNQYIAQSKVSTGEYGKYNFYNYTFTLANDKLTVDGSENAHDGEYTKSAEKQIAAGEYKNGGNYGTITIAEDWSFKLVNGTETYEGTYCQVDEKTYYVTCTYGEGSVFYSQFDLVATGVIKTGSTNPSKYGSENYVMADPDMTEFFGSAKIGDDEISRISINTTKEAGYAIMDYMYFGYSNRPNTLVLLTKSSLSKLTDTSKTETPKYLYNATYGTSGKFTLAVYEDGTVEIGNADGKFIATFVKPISTTYTGEATWYTGLVTKTEYKITKITIYTNILTTEATVTYSIGGAEKTEKLTIEKSTYASYFTGKYGDHKISYYYQHNSGGIAFVIAIYDDGTLMVGDSNDGYLATFEKQA